MCMYVASTQRISGLVTYNATYIIKNRLATLKIL